MHIRELMQRSGVTERQVRYLIAEGFMPGPAGGRANADYSEDHLRTVQRYGRLRELGFPPAAIKLLLAAREGTPFAIVPGITLLVSPDIVAGGLDPAPVVAQIETLLTRILKTPTDGGERD